MNERLLNLYFRILILKAIIAAIIECMTIVKREMANNQKEIDRYRNWTERKITEANNIKLRVDDLFKDDFRK